MTELDELRQVIDESHRMIVDEDTGRRWKELYKEAQEQIAKLTEQRRVGAEAIMELFGIADIINSFPEAPRSDGREGALGRRVEGLIREQRQQLSDERQSHDTTKRLLADQINKRWKLQQALQSVANSKCTNGRRSCSYCSTYVEEGHRDYCVVGPALDAVRGYPGSNPLTPDMIAKYATQGGTVVVWRAWRNNMRKQGRQMAENRMRWDTLPEQDKELDRLICEDVVTHFANWLIGQIEDRADDGSE